MSIICPMLCFLIHVLQCMVIKSLRAQAVPKRICATDSTNAVVQVLVKHHTFVR